MGKIINDESLTFGDVLLRPNYSTIESRSNINLSVNINKEFKFETPLIPANMKSIISKEMAVEIVKLKSLGFMHRFCSFEEQFNVIKHLQSINFGYDPMKYFGVSVGVKDEDKINIEKFYNSGVRVFCIDIAHGHSRSCGEMTKFIKSNFNNCLVAAGNVATHDGAKFLWDCGADIVKVGIGGGCLGGNSKILMADGSYKEIKEINEGDYVIDGKGNPTKVLNKIYSGVKPVLSIKTPAFSEILYATRDHNFLTKKNKNKEKWVEIEDASNLNLLAVKNKNNFNPKCVQMYEFDKNNYIEMDTYDIEVESDDHSFIANNLIVHNSICTTRLKAGAGVPQLSAIKEIYDFKLKNPEYMDKKFISDGGIRVIGDCVKALAFADMIMMGNAFSGCEETPEEMMEIDGQKYKKYAGSSTHKATHIEGVVSLVNAKGKFKDIVEEYSQGIKSGCSYAGCSNLSELKYYATFIKITNSSKEESGSHDVKVIK